jgi:hypothetical protein
MRSTEFHASLYPQHSSTQYGVTAGGSGAGGHIPGLAQTAGARITGRAQSFDLCTESNSVQLLWQMSARFTVRRCAE